MRTKLLLIAAAAVLLLAAGASAHAPLLNVSTEFGEVVGMVETVGSWSSISWRGIPYAAKPVGSLRWAAAQPPDPWSSPIQATRFGPGCPQDCVLPPHTCPAATAEDCLYANVWAPLHANPGSNLPVLFFVHGGHFEQGSGEGPFYSGTAWANNQDVVVVTFNYRLGALGWLRTSSGMTGNYGLTDQLAALRWARANVRNFGGDPTHITIFGESAGGTSVSTMLTSPSFAGLFRNVIVESNPIALPLMAQSEGESLGSRFTTDAGCDDGDNACLMGLDVPTILAAQAEAARHINIGDILELFYMWTPTIDGQMVLDEPLNLMMSGQVNTPVTLQIGTVEEEGLLFVYSGLSSSMGSLEYEAVVLATFGWAVGHVLDQYPSQSGTDNRVQLSRLATDYLFKCPSRAALRGVVNSTSATGYMYRFNHSFSFDGWGPNYTFCDGHVCHGSELPFVFDLSQDTDVVQFSPAEVQLGMSMNTAWAAVALGDAPSAEPEWNAYDASADNTYVFMAESQFSAPGLDTDICDFWDSIGYHF